MDHPLTDHDLLALLLGDLDAAPDQAGQIRAAAGADALVAQRLARLESMLRTLGRARTIESLFETDAAMVQKLAASTSPARRSSLIDRVADVLARLTFDSAQASPALAGFRGAAGPRRLTLETDDLAVELELDVRREPVAGLVPGQVSVLGRVSRGGPGEAVWLEPVGEGGAIDAEIDDSGFFEFLVAPGRYDLRVRGPGSTMLAEGIDLKDGP